MDNKGYERHVEETTVLFHHRVRLESAAASSVVTLFFNFMTGLLQNSP